MLAGGKAGEGVAEEREKKNGNQDRDFAAG